MRLDQRPALESPNPGEPLPSPSPDEEPSPTPNPKPPIKPLEGPSNVRE